MFGEEQQGGGVKTVILGAIVVVIATALIVGGVILLTQPTAPPSSTANATPTPAPVIDSSTPAPTTAVDPIPVEPDGGIGDGASPIPSGSGTGVDQTAGGVSEGVVTSICGDSSPSASGIGTSQGTCGRCTNLSGTDGSCEPEAGEQVVVIGCDDQTGIECSTASTGVVIDTSTVEVFLSDYAEEACTVQFSIVDAEIDLEATPTEIPTDYIVYQNDDCSEIPSVGTGSNDMGTANMGDTGSDTDASSISPGSGTGTNGSTGAGGPQCGATCSSNFDCPLDSVCGSSGACELIECAANPSLCMADLCTLMSDASDTGDATGGTGTGAGTGAGAGTGTGTGTGTTDNSTAPGTLPVTGGEPRTCGQACTATSDCAAGLTCGAATGVCTDSQCVTSGAPNCQNGCYVPPTTAPTSGDAKLPDTALISEEVDLLILGTLFVFMAALAWRTNSHIDLFYLLGGRQISAFFSDKDRKILEEQRQQQDVIRKRQEIKRNKQDRSKFERELVKD